MCMRATDLIKALQTLQKEWGDLEVGIRLEATEHANAGFWPFRSVEVRDMMDGTKSIEVDTY